jgi:hypothetical protein
MIKPLTRRTSDTPPAAPDETGAKPKGDEINERIGRDLRAMFDHVVAEPVPEKFRELLDELERRSRKP